MEFEADQLFGKWHVRPFAKLKVKLGSKEIISETEALLENHFRSEGGK